MTYFFKNFFNWMENKGKESDKKRPKPGKEGTKAFSNGYFFQNCPQKKPGAAAQPDVSPANGEAQIQPDPHQKRGKNQIRKLSVASSQRAQKSVKQPQKQSQQTGDSKLPGCLGGSRQPIRRLSQPPLLLGSS